MQRERRVVRWLRHAFAVEAADTFEATPEERAAADKLLRALVRRGLGTPALLMLECSRPLNFVASQFLLFVGPVAELIFDRAAYRTFIGLLERRGSVEYLCRRLEALLQEPPAADGPTPADANEDESR